MPKPTNEVINETPNESNNWPLPNDQNKPPPNDQENQPPRNHKDNQLPPFDLNIGTLRHCIRIYRSPSYHQDYHCSLVTHSNLLLYRPLLTIYKSEVVAYLLHKFIFYNTLFFKHFAFAVAIFVEVEAISYTQAMRHPNGEKLWLLKFKLSTRKRVGPLHSFLLEKCLLTIKGCIKLNICQMALSNDTKLIL